MRNVYTSRDSDSLALAHTCVVGIRRREHPSTASEHLASTESATLVVAGLEIPNAGESVHREANRDGRTWVSESCRIGGREDAEQHSEDVGTHGGSV